jgi:hypothetical protein
MKKQSNDLSLMSRDVLWAYAQRKVYHYPDFPEYYKDLKPIFDDLKTNKDGAYKFYKDVCDGLI